MGECCLLKMRLKALTMVMISLLLLTGCLNSTSGNEPSSTSMNQSRQTLNVLLAVNNDSPSSKYRSDTITKYLREFEAANPGITIIVEQIPLLNLPDDLSKKLHYADLYFGPYLPNLSEEGVLADLLPLFKANQMTTDDFYTALTDMLTASGRLIGIPMSPYLTAVFYNKSWFDKADIEYPSGDWTWEQYFDVSLKLYAANKDEGNALFGSIGGANFDYFEQLLHSKGIRMISPDASQTTGYLDSPEAVNVFMELLHHLNRNTSVKKTDATGRWIIEDLKTSRAGMGAGISDLYPYLAGLSSSEGRFGIASLPRLEDGRRANVVYVHTFSITASSQNKELAWKFLKDVVLNNESAFQKNWGEQDLLTLKSASVKTGQTDMPHTSVLLDELNYAVKPIAYHNPNFTKLWMNQEIINELNRLFTVTSREDAQVSLTRIAQRMDEL